MHIGFAYEHLVWNVHPVGMSIGLGMSPSIICLADALAFLGSAMGIADRRAFVAIELSMASVLQFLVFALGEENAWVSTISHFTANIFEVIIFVSL